MREYEMEVLEKYELEVNSTRRIRGAFYCDTKEGTMLLKETKISERRVPLLYLILNRLEKQGYLVDTPVFSKEGDLVQNSRDGTRYLMKKWYPGEECNLKRHAGERNISEIPERRGAGNLTEYTAVSL